METTRREINCGGCAVAAIHPDIIGAKSAEPIHEQYLNGRNAWRFGLIV